MHGRFLAGANCYPCDNIMTFGLRDNTAENQPFLLVQRPNQSPRVPEPGTLALPGLAFVGFAAMRRRHD